MRNRESNYVGLMINTVVTPISDMMHRHRYFEYSVEDVIEFAIDPTLLSSLNINDNDRSQLSKLVHDTRMYLKDVLEDDCIDINQIKYWKWNKQRTIMFMTMDE